MLEIYKMYIALKTSQIVIKPKFMYDRARFITTIARNTPPTDNLTILAAFFDFELISEYIILSPSSGKRGNILKIAIQSNKVDVQYPVQYR
jgi:hypothetical protein